MGVGIRKPVAMRLELQPVITSALAVLLCQAHSQHCKPAAAQWLQLWSNGAKGAGGGRCGVCAIADEVGFALSAAIPANSNPCIRAFGNSTFNIEALVGPDA